jgi:hypothetical protein
MNDFQYFLYKLRLGNFGLAKTFWTFLIGAWLGEILLQFFLIFSPLSLGYLPTLIHLAFCMLYLPPAVFGTWNAAGKYRGPKIWAWLAQAIVILIVFFYVISLLLYIYATFFGATTMLINSFH